MQSSLETEVPLMCCMLSSPLPSPNAYTESMIMGICLRSLVAGTKFIMTDLTRSITWMVITPYIPTSLPCT